MPSSVVYATVDEMKEQIDKRLDDEDTNLLVLLTAASRAIDNHCKRFEDGFVAGTVATARIFRAYSLYYVFVDDCTEITLVEAKDSATDDAYETWTSNQWYAFRGSYEHPNYNGLPYHGIKVNLDYTAVDLFAISEQPTVRVTARWGYADVVPEPIKQATIIQASRWFKQGQSAWADTLTNPDVGTLQFRQQLDPDIQQLVTFGGYVRQQY